MLDCRCRARGVTHEVQESALAFCSCLRGRRDGWLYGRPATGGAEPGSVGVVADRQRAGHTEVTPCWGVCVLERLGEDPVRGLVDQPLMLGDSALLIADRVWAFEERYRPTGLFCLRCFPMVLLASEDDVMHVS